MSAPAVSVAMPVRNAMPYLGESIRSIREQTMGDFEFVIVDDGSTDGSTELLRDCAHLDSRIRLIEQEGEHALETTLNALVAATTTPFVARMDADDLSHPQRLERQLEVISGDDTVVVVGSLADGIDSAGRRVRPRDRWRLIRCSQAPFAGASAMFSRARFTEVGGYREGTWPAEDVDLLVRLGDRGRILVLPDPLYSYRYHLGASSLTVSTDRAIRSMQRLNRTLAQSKDGRSGATTFEDPEDAAARDAAFKAVHRARTGHRLWAGHPPAALGDLARAGRLSPRPSNLRALLFGSWGAISPATLRAAVRGFIRARDLAASTRVRDGKAREWHFGKQVNASDVGSGRSRPSDGV